MTAKVSLGDVVASRVVQLHGPGDESATLLIEIGKPQENGRDFCCPFRISGGSVDLTRAVWGVDSAQALVGALQVISVELEDVARRKGGTVTWLGSSDLGFPSIGAGVA